MATVMGASGLLAKPEDLQVGQEEELGFLGGPAAVEIRRLDLECPGCKRQRPGRGTPPSVAAGKDVLLFEQLCEAVNLIRGYGNAPAVCQTLPHVLQHVAQAARKPGRVGKGHGLAGHELAISRGAQRQDTTSIQRLVNARPECDGAAKTRG